MAHPGPCVAPHGHGCLSSFPGRSSTGRAAPCSSGSWSSSPALPTSSLPRSCSSSMTISTTSSCATNGSPASGPPTHLLLCSHPLTFHLPQTPGQPPRAHSQLSSSSAGHSAHPPPAPSLLSPLCLHPASGLASAVAERVRPQPHRPVLPLRPHPHPAPNRLALGPWTSDDLIRAP